MADCATIQKTSDASNIVYIPVTRFAWTEGVEKWQYRLCRYIVPSKTRILKIPPCLISHNIARQKYIKTSLDMKCVIIQLNEVIQILISQSFKKFPWPWKYSYTTYLLNTSCTKYPMDLVAEALTASEVFEMEGQCHICYKFTSKTIAVSSSSSTL